MSAPGPRTDPPWPAPSADGPVAATVRLPGSKSVTNRALVIAALSAERSRISAPLRARDTLLMAEALRRMGTTVEDDRGDWLVVPGPLHGPAAVDCGLAGTVMRFVPPLAALASGRVDLDGDPRARERPMGTVVTALRTLGATIQAAPGDRLPLTIEGNGSLPGGHVTIDASASSQFVSGLLLAGARFDRGVDVRHDGKPMPSAPHVAMTVSMLRAAGATVDTAEPNRWVVFPGPLTAPDTTVEPDLSNAAPFLAAAVVTAGTVTVRGWPTDTDQAGDRLREILPSFGATVRLGDDGLTVSGPDRPSGVDLDLQEVGELTPVLAAICALASSPSWLRGIAHLRGHETDRLAAIAAELTRLGCAVDVLDDGLAIRPRPLRGGLFRTYDDHRMAQAAAVVGLAVPGVEIENVATTGKTHPDFARDWSAMLA